MCWLVYIMYHDTLAACVRYKPADTHEPIGLDIILALLHMTWCRCARAQVDVWALGVSAIEMAEVTPPRWAVHPMRVIFMISRDPPPQLADKDRWSLPFHDFVAQSLQKACAPSLPASDTSFVIDPATYIQSVRAAAMMQDPKARPSAKYLQQHKFVCQHRPGAAASLRPLMWRAQNQLALMNSNAALHGLPSGIRRACPCLLYLAVG